MSRQRPDVSVPCPCCGQADVGCWIDPGEPMVTSGPSDGWYPGSPPGLDDFEAGCECSDFLDCLKDGGRAYREYRDLLAESALDEATSARESAYEAAMEARYEMQREEGR